MSVSFLSCICLDEEDGEMESPVVMRAAERRSLGTSELTQQEGTRSKKRPKDKVLIFTGALGSRDQCDDWDVGDDGESSDDGYEYQSDSLFDSESRQINWKWPTDFEPLESILQDSTKLDMITEVQRRIGISPKNYLKMAKKTDFPLDKCTIVRYLEAHLWTIDGVAENIMETIEWRLSMGMPKFDRATLRKELETGKFFCRGKARDGRPLVYLLLGKENTWNADGNTAAVLYTLERALASMNKQVQEAVYVIDCQDVGITTAPSTAFVGQLIGILGRHYPRRLGQIFICNVSSVFYFIWNVVSLTLKEMTVKKIQILTSDVDEMRTRIGEFVAPDHLHTDYGGEATFDFDVDEYLQSGNGLLR